MIRKKALQESEVRENMRGGQGRVTIRHYFKKNEIRASCRLCAQLEIPPGAGIGLHEHTGEDEVYIIQQGKGVISEGDRETEVEAGDTILTGGGATHAIRNTGTEDLLVTAVIMLY